MLATLVGVAAMSQVFRTIAAIVAPGLQREFGLSTEELGIYAGAFHLSFALAQIPMGLALDLYGVRKTVGSAFLLAVAGALLSFIATGFPVLMLGQLLIGIGCAPAFVGSLFFVSKHFPEKSFARVSGLVLSFSGLGLLATGTPLAWVVEHWGWRSAFAVTGAMAAANLACILVLVRDDHGKNSGDIAGAIRETLAILKKRQTKGIVALALVGYSSYIALRGLWATPLFMERHGFTLTDVGKCASRLIGRDLGWPTAIRSGAGERTLTAIPDLREHGHFRRDFPYPCNLRQLDRRYYDVRCAWGAHRLHDLAVRRH
ncbi:MFS transporter [Mesorhizobium muleiense]|uniref:MFS transporter n=1 Tax=Mesorhizobium muleiense TaxID=1004279 RepID=UPI001F231132|nr:MFS transporter [Mesorhizobium muleiense]